MDFQSIMGKSPMGVAKLGKKYNIPVIALAGSLADDIDVVDSKESNVKVVKKKNTLYLHIFTEFDKKEVILSGDFSVKKMNSHASKKKIYFN